MATAASRHQNHPIEFCTQIKKKKKIIRERRGLRGGLERESEEEGNLGGERNRGERDRGAFWSPLKELRFGIGIYWMFEAFSFFFFFLPFFLGRGGGQMFDGVLEMGECLRLYSYIGDKRKAIHQ